MTWIRQATTPIECWGGATFDSCLRYLNEDPWERLRNIKSHMKNTKLQMLLRGQNLLGYHHYSDDTVRRFVRKSIENGMDIIRIFDALNDLRNIETAVDECIKSGGHAQGCICYTLSPIHNLEMFVSLGKQIEADGLSTRSASRIWRALCLRRSAIDLVYRTQARTSAFRFMCIHTRPPDWAI